MRTIVVLETLIWAGAGFLAALSISMLLIASDASADRSAFLVLTGRVLFGGALGIAVGTLTAWMMTRESHLFRYFKER